VTAEATAGDWSLTMDPGTCLSGGTVVTVSAAGFTPGSTGVFLECNSDPDQPTTAGIPVSCANPFDLSTEPPDQTVSETGTVGPVSLTTLVGTIGPPCAPWDCSQPGDSPDSAGGNPTTDAAAYPCPPTPAEAAAGDTCELIFSDADASEGVALHLSYNANGPRRSATHTRHR
jgi:hypothetical protein